MNPRELAQHSYYASTLPLRRLIRHRLESSGRAPLSVLFYHRVADEHPNDWTISNAEFRRQILWLKEHFDLVSLEEIQRRMQDGKNHRAAVAITFDDGYAENCQQAIPFLVEHEVPATYFVSLGYIVNQLPFPHDRERNCPLAVNTMDDIREISRAGIEIGAHTRSHCDIGKVADVSQLIDEVVHASDELAERIRQPVRYFAFPFGQIRNLSAAAVELAKRRGFLGVCSAYGAYNFPDADPFHIQRIHADPQFIRLKNWMTLDPRKLRIGKDFQFPEAAVRSSQIRSDLNLDPETVRIPQVANLLKSSLTSGLQQMVGQKS